MKIAIIGGGLIGLSAAWRLRQSGFAVTVWEAGSLGREASWAGAGMLAPGGEMHRRTWWGDLALKSLQLYPEFVRDLSSDSGIYIDYRPCGALEFAHNDQDWTAMQQRAACQRDWAIVTQVVGERQLFYPDDAAVNPRHLLDALRAVCARTGVTMREGSEVSKIVVERGRITEPEPADIAVLAAGAWSSKIGIMADGSEIPIEPAVPIRGHLVSFASMGPGAGPNLARRPNLHPGALGRKSQSPEAPPRKPVSIALPIPSCLCKSCIVHNS